MSGLQEFVSAQTGGQPPTWLEASAFEHDIVPQEQETSFAVRIYRSLLADMTTKEIYEKRRRSFYESLLRVTPQGGFQTDFPSAASNFGYLRRRLKASSDAVKNSVDMNLQIMHGNPVFRGTRIPIYQIIDELADGTPLEEIPEGYPSLTLEQIQNGLDFAASVLRIYDDQISHR